MIVFRRWLWVLLGWVFLSPAVLHAFGKNKIQHRPYHFKLYQTTHFSIYAYEGGEFLARFAGAVLEEAVKEYEPIFHLTLKEPIPVILYNTPKDFQETNVTLDLLEEGVGGFTELFRSRMVIPYSGSWAEFRHVLRHELVHAFQYRVLWKGVRDFQSILSLQLPLWVVEGMAEYLSQGWSSDAEAFLRDQVFHGQLYPIPVLNYAAGYVVYKEGQAIYRYIEDTYGRERLLSLFYELKFQKNIGRAFKKAFGVSLEKFNEDFLFATKKRFLSRVKGATFPEPPAFRRMTDHRKTEGFLNVGPALTPDGDYLAVVTDRNGNTDIVLLSGIDGRPIRKLVSGERTPDLENLHLLRPSLAFSPDGAQLAFVSQSQNGDLLHIVDIHTGKRRTFASPLAEGLATPTWDPVHRRIYLVGLHNGQSDLLVFDLRTQIWEWLTRDRADDRDPRCDPTGTYLYFVTDDARVQEDSTMVYGSYRLARINLETGERELLTPPLGQISSPLPDTDGVYVVWTPGGEQVSRLMKVFPQTDTWAEVMRFWSGLREVSVTRNFQRFAFSALYQGGYDVFLWLPDSLSFQPQPLVTTPPDTVKMVPFDSTAPYIPLAHIGLDWIQGTAIYTPYLGAAGYLALQMSDLLGNHRLTFVGQAYYSFLQPLKDADLILDYLYLPHRTDYEVIYAQFPNFSVLRPDSLYLYSRERVLQFMLRYPFTRFLRAELGVGYEWPTYYTLRRVFQENPVLGLVQEAYVVAGQEDYWDVAFAASLVWDNVRYSYYTLGPQNGSRARLLYVETALPLLEPSSSRYRSYRTLLADLRWYQKLSPRSLFAWRGYAEINSGRDALPGWIGGPESLRGYDYFQFAGNWVGFSNLELRFPLIDHLQLAVPPISLGNIRGALFLDAGVVADQWGTLSLSRDLHLSTGLGFRWDLGFTLLKVDLVRPFDLQQGWTGPWFTQFSLGPEF